MQKTHSLLYFGYTFMMRFFSSLCCVSFFLASCSQDDWEKKAAEVESRAHSIFLELKGVNSRENLEEKQDRLKNLFHLFVVSLCEADASRRAKGYNGDFSMSLHECKSLQTEVYRILSIEGCKEILQICQREALHFLDAYDRKHQRQDPFSLLEKKGHRVLR